MDDSFVTVRAGQQNNGTLAIEHIFSKTTTTAQEALSRAAILFNDGSPISGTESRRTATATSNGSFIANEQIVSPGIALPPFLELPNEAIPPIVMAIPEPETYALMGLGFAALYCRKWLKK